MDSRAVILNPGCRSTPGCYELMSGLPTNTYLIQLEVRSNTALFQGNAIIYMNLEQIKGVNV